MESTTTTPMVFLQYLPPYPSTLELDFILTNLPFSQKNVPDVEKKYEMIFYTNKMILIDNGKMFKKGTANSLQSRVSYMSRYILIK